MNYLIVRQIFQELRRLQKNQKQIGLYLADIFKQKYHESVAKRQAISKKYKKQGDNELAEAFLNILKQANNETSFTAHKSRIKLVQIFLNLNPFVNNQFKIRHEILSKQMQILEKQQQFIALKSAEEKDFVRSIIKKVFEKEEGFPYSNLTSFLKDVRSQNTKLKKEKALQNIEPHLQLYIKKILNGQIQKRQLNQRYQKVYKSIFDPPVRSAVEMVLDSYIESNFIFRDFDKIGPIK